MRPCPAIRATWTPLPVARASALLPATIGASLLIISILALSVPVHARSLPDFTLLVEQSAAAVVNISTTQKRRVSGRSQRPEGIEIPDLPEGSPFNDFFRRFFGEGGELREFESPSLGSGFLISSDGYIISNNHVIRNAEEVVVRLSDRREFTAEVIGGDERSDVALLKIEADDLPTVRLGRGYHLKVGEWVLAIGSPFGFEHSATAGIVSATGRSLPRENYVPFIQTDVAINPGNSGGPLFNLDGEVVGVNSQIFSRTGGFMGLSFAIPIDVAMDVADQLRTQGRVSRGWLGVLIQDVTRELAESFGMGKPEGALIAKVLDDSPAANAGFEVGDIVLSFNEERVGESSDLPPIVGRTRVGTKVPVEILRDGGSKTLYVLTAELPEEETLRASTRRGFSRPSADRLGISVVDLSNEQRKSLGVDVGGVLVRKVEDGPAKEAGVLEGDVILRLHNAEVRDSRAFTRIFDELPANKPISILVQRDGNPIWLALKSAP